MKVRVSYVKHYLPFKTAYQHKGIAKNGKEVLYVQAVLEDGSSFLGEISPFWGVSSENISDVLSSHELVQGDVSLPEIEESHLGGLLQSNIMSLQTPSIRNAWDQILLQIYWSKKKRHLESNTEVAGLIVPDRDSLVEQLLSLKSRGVKTFKVKVGRLQLSEEKSLLQKLCSLLELEDKVRLDANRSLTVDQAYELYDIIGGHLEYFEEPFANDGDHFVDHPFRLAYDELLWEQPGCWQDCKRDAVLIAKPIRLGLGCIFQWLDAGWDPNKIILSSCFESGVSTRVYSLLCEYLELRGAHGFGPYFSLKQDYLASPIRIENARMKVSWNAGGFISDCV